MPTALTGNFSGNGRLSACAERSGVLGKVELWTDNSWMSNEDPDKGFQFPGDFEITAMGAVGSGLERVIPQELEAAGLTVLSETVRSRESSGGRFISITISFRALSREDYDAAHVALRAHPDVKWTL